MLDLAPAPHPSMIYRPVSHCDLTMCINSRPRLISAGASSDSIHGKMRTRKSTPLRVNPVSGSEEPSLEGKVVYRKGSQLFGVIHHDK